MIKDIIIIGGGWYGCYAAFLLQNKYNIILVEEKHDIFYKNSSLYNQNRHHLGYHYPRNYNTRNLCKKYFNNFIDLFKNTGIVNDINRNYYIISQNSIIDYKTYCNIYKAENYNFSVLQNNIFNNIDGDIILTNEKYINANEAKKFFKNNLKCKFKYNTKVIKIEKKNDKINILFNDSVTKLQEEPSMDNKEIEEMKEPMSSINCDLIIDCTYNLLNLSTKEYIYEKNIILIFEKISNIEFDAVTIMDGNFCSLYPLYEQKNFYTLTDVEYTPLIRSKNLNDIINYKFDENNLQKIIDNMTNKIKYYYKNFSEVFNYHSFALSNKTKIVSSNDTRECNIEKINDNLITINCGKIIGIFEMENYFKNINLI